MHDEKIKENLKKLPQINRILQVFNGTNKAILKRIAISRLDAFRAEILAGKHIQISEQFILDSIQNDYQNAIESTLKPLINATGVVIQTNFGRSIFSLEILNEILPNLARYNNLEYSLESGTRSERYFHIEKMLCAIFGVESALLVNNNAASVLLILNTFANNKEAIISRGEIIEIGGSFRINEVMNISGAKIKEIGTTNKTKISDYKNAINAESAMIVKAHKSNYSILGFSQEVEINEISALCAENNLIDYYDLGSGFIAPIECSEPNLLQICQNPPSLISFSGDKLLGGPQAGIILGKKSLIEKLKQNHLLRALRVDKTTILLLEATLRRYINKNYAEIPTLNMLFFSRDELQNRALKLKNLIPSFFNPNIIELNSRSGGGSLPNVEFSSFGISIFVKHIKPSFLEQKLREQRVIARIIESKIALDVRCILDCEFEELKIIFENLQYQLQAECNE